MQEFVLGFKHHKDLIGDFLRTTSEITAKYEKKTLENTRHWTEVKKDIDLGADVSVGANGLFYFFAKGTGNPTVGKLLGAGKLLDALKEDVKVSKYILTQYPKAVMQEMKALASILRSANFKHSGDIIKMAAQVEKLKTPVELFDSKYHSQELLGATQLHAQAARPRKMPPSTTYKAMPRMAEMAGAKHVGFKGQKSMNYMRGVGAAASTVGATALNVAAPGLGNVLYTTHKLATSLPMAAVTSHKETAYTFKASEIGVVLDIAEAYTDNVRACVGYEREIVRVMDELDAAIERANNSSDDVVEELIKLEKTDREAADKGWNEYQEACHVFEQIMAFANALRRAIQKPVHGEAARSLRAAKYCNYLALRAIYNADRKKVATEDYEEPSPELKAKYEQTKHQYDKIKAQIATASGSHKEALEATLSRLSRELRGHDLWPLTMKDGHHVATENADETPPADAAPANDAPATNASDEVTPEAQKAEGEAEGDDIHTKHAKRMKRLGEAHDQQQKLLKDANTPEKHGVAKEAVKNLVAQMQQALAEYQEQVEGEEAPATESIDPDSFGSRFARAFKK